MFVFGVLAAVTGVVVFHLALASTLHANAGIRIPLFRNGEVVPRGSVALRAIGAGLIVFGAVMLGMTAWYLPFLVILVGPVAALVAIVVHNAAARRRARA
ncbi:hypothetical protein OED01_13655 [Microbacterium sp. M28]|uniref:hypothetical protein n=1 Tax=Microbacterium sp. M28 TaxID=2962064 RepID=UPI0021F4A410|nr:hypothetical protein [Microbacterium sp. M28]UYO96636.1 hypothetical protein OED01_13655 [Microbacterium sp. M28]